MNELSPVATLAVLLAAALVGGMIAHRLRQPVVLGYLLIGVVVGPHALGLVENIELVETAAAIGVALLMFTLGLEISVAQLREGGKAGIWGGIVQISVTLGLGILIGRFAFQWPMAQAVLFGLIISLSSTAVCLKVLMERGELVSVHGRIMVAILILQDVSVVVMMVVVPLLGGAAENLLLTLGMAVGKSLLFIAGALVLGRWLLPWLMGTVGRVRAKELFLLTVLVLCLGAAIGTQIFGLSMVFGAFLIGMVLRETRFVHQALAEITPLRDIFATLFFVSLGMLLDPFFMLENWSLILLTVVVIIVLKSLVIFFIVRFFGQSNRIAVLVGTGLFQIGEFSFIFAQVGVDMGIASEKFYSLMLASAIITMLLTPLVLSLLSQYLFPRLALRVPATTATAGAKRGAPVKKATLDIFQRVIVAGYGRVGQNIVQGLQNAEISHIVIDIDPERVSEAKASGNPRIYGDASNIHVLLQAGIGRASTLVITFPDPMAVVTTAKVALSLNPKIKILARVHRQREADILRQMGVTELISPEYEASVRFMEKLLAVIGLEEEEQKQVLEEVLKGEEIAEFSPEET